MSEKNHPNLITIIPECINISHFIPGKIYKPSFVIYNTCNIPIILNLRSSDRSKLILNENLIRIDVNQSKKINLVIQDNINYSIGKIPSKKKLYINLNGEFIEEKYDINLIYFTYETEPHIESESNIEGINNLTSEYLKHGQTKLIKNNENELCNENQIEQINPNIQNNLNSNFNSESTSLFDNNIDNLKNNYLNNNKIKSLFEDNKDNKYNIENNNEINNSNNINKINNNKIINNKYNSFNITKYKNIIIENKNDNNEINKIKNNEEKINENGYKDKLIITKNCDFQINCNQSNLEILNYKAKNLLKRMQDMSNILLEFEKITNNSKDRFDSRYLLKSSMSLYSLGKNVYQVKFKEKTINLESNLDSLEKMWTLTKNRILLTEKEELTERCKLLETKLKQLKLYKENKN